MLKLNQMLKEIQEDRLLLHLAGHISEQNGSVAIDQLAAQFYVNRRTIERQFNRRIGISPKKFAGIPLPTGFPAQESRL